MSILSSITKGKKTAYAFTFCGDAGTGKTTIASTFPKPIFIKSEDGTGLLEVDSFPLLKNVDMLWEQLGALIKEEHDYKTVIIDSVTGLEDMFSQYIIESDPKKPKSINSALGGYGAGLNALANMHGRVRKAAQMLLDKGINVIFIAHTETTILELPDQDPYHRYDLKLGKRSMTHYVDNVDLVGFLKLQTYTFGDGDRKKATSDGTRVLVTYATASNISKNRFGIKEDLVIVEGQNPLKNIINLGE